MLIPEYRGKLRSARLIEVPECISCSSGIRIFGRLIKSVVFSTDIAILKNINADAAIAVYPFTPQSSITHAIIQAADMPVFTGVGGGLIQGDRVLALAMDAESQGAFGVVVNAPTKNEVITMLKKNIDIPVIVTVVSVNSDYAARIKAGADIFNVSGAANTPLIVNDIRKSFPDFPIIATGGPNEKTILETIEAGANAITFTPPSNAELFRITMEKYRKEQSG